MIQRFAQPAPILCPTVSGTGWAGSNPQKSAPLSLFCLTYLTYLYIFYIGEQCHRLLLHVAERYAVRMGRLGNAGRSPQKSAPQGMSNLCEFGWAVPNLGPAR